MFGGEGGPASTLAPKLGPLGLVWWWLYYLEPKKNWWGYHQGGKQMEGHQSHDPIEVLKQSSRNHHPTHIILTPHQGAGKAWERPKEGQEWYMMCIYTYIVKHNGNLSIE